MASFTITSVVNAPIEVVFDVVTDHRGYSGFTPLRSVELEQEGTPPPNGVGAIRVLRAVGPPIREQVTEYERPTRFAYKMLSGAPLRDHVGTVELTPEQGKTRMVYEVQTFPTVPSFLAPALVAFMRLIIGQLAGGMVKRAEQLASSGA
jgi:uncharacterized protein YndB with AHSA1/START domain